MRLHLAVLVDFAEKFPPVTSVRVVGHALDVAPMVFSLAAMFRRLRAESFQTRSVHFLIAYWRGGV